MGEQLLKHNSCSGDAKLNAEAFRCSRCGGLMKRESVFDLVENEIEFKAARCIQCGDIVDPVILMNRSGKGVLSGSSGRARH